VSWKPGDRVKVLLPARGTGPGHKPVWIAGTVRDVDEPGLPPGVRVDLDVLVRGVRDCYATHGELETLDT
jgi:hypothetical protein